MDQIYHLACPASPVHYKYNPVKTIKTNVLGTLNMLGLAKRVKARFLLTSTSEVYGDPLEHPQTEAYWGNVNPIGERSCYDEGKRVAETLTFDYHREHGVDIRVARIFNTYGPRMALDDGRVVSNFVSQALRGEPMTVYGDPALSKSLTALLREHMKQQQRAMHAHKRMCTPPSLWLATRQQSGDMLSPPHWSPLSHPSWVAFPQPLCR